MTGHESPHPDIVVHQPGVNDWPGLTRDQYVGLVEQIAASTDAFVVTAVRDRDGGVTRWVHGIRRMREWLGLLEHQPISLSIDGVAYARRRVARRRRNR